MFDRFTDRARKVMSLARNAAIELRHDAIEAEHLLLGLLREGTGVAAAVLDELSIPADRIRDRVLAALPRGDAPPDRGEVPLATSCQTALEAAGLESSSMACGYIGSEHLLLGLLAEPSARPGRILRAAGVGLDAARQEVLRWLGGTRVPAVRRIVSGGQTGVDRAALDVALEFGIEHGGWCPRGRRAEDGGIPAKYALRETESSNYRVRTERNVVDSDATLILSRGQPTGGTALTLRLCRQRQRPHCVVDLDQDVISAIRQAAEWIVVNPIAVLNVAGPRESTAPGIGAQAANVLRHVILATRR